MKPWKKLRQRVQGNAYRPTVFKTFLLPDGTEAEFATTGKYGAEGVAIIAITPEKKVVLVHEFRPGPERLMQELPGGVVDEGEDLEAAARRELSEETGYTCDSLQYLGMVYRDAYSNNVGHYFLGTNARKTDKQQLDPREFSEVAVVSLDTLVENALSGNMTDAAAVLLAQKELEKIAP